MINERIEKLRALMKEQQVDMYYIPTSDYHDSEYVGEHFQSRAYMSGFTGSAGVMLITLEEALLWSDGRYYIQGEKQTSGTNVRFMRQGEVGVLSPLAYMQKHLKEGGVIGFDGRCVTTQLGRTLERVIEQRKGSLHFDLDFVSAIWTDRPELKKSELFILDVKYSGEGYGSKVEKVRAFLDQNKADATIFTALDDVAHILNLRGRDIPCTPVFLSNLIVTKDKTILYVDLDKLNADVKAYLAENDIVVKDYEVFYSELPTIDAKDLVLDLERVNYTIYCSLKNIVNIKHQTNPTVMMKSIKNDIQLENLRIAHIKDGVALTKFMHWLKTNVGKEAMDEYSVDKVITGLREQQEHFIEPSFDSICGYNANAAMMHYKAKKDMKAEIKAEGILLVDSGGQYLEGTTDITRTFALGAVDPIWKRNFSLVLKGMSALSRTQFLEGVNGINLDILARQPLWEYGLDYKCGTGHGVGFLSGVHEGPQGFRWKAMSDRKEDTSLAPGMIITNEPGAYIEGSHGIRIENELIVKKSVKNGMDQFLNFETITFAPIDLDLIDTAYLDAETIAWLNDYHKEVFEKISPYLNEDESTWLKTYTRSL